MMKSDIDPDVFLSEVFQLFDELIDLGEAVTDECLTTIILNALPEERCPVPKRFKSRIVKVVIIAVVSQK